MASNFWNNPDGEDVRKEVTDAKADLPSNGGGDFAPLPDKTKVLAIIESAGVKEKDGNRYAYAVLEIIKPEGYARRKLFPTFWVFDDNPNAEDKEKKRTNDLKRFTKLDAACGGILARKNDAPDDALISDAFTDKQVIVHVMQMKPKNGDDPFNWYSDYWPKGTKELSEVAKPSPGTGGGGRAKRADNFADDLDDDIPFAVNDTIW